MPKKLPISTQREILRLREQVFNLKQKLARTEDKYEKQIAKLKARKQPIITEKERAELIERRDKALEANARL